MCLKVRDDRDGARHLLGADEPAGGDACEVHVIGLELGEPGDVYRRAVAVMGDHGQLLLAVTHHNVAGTPVRALLTDSPSASSTQTASVAVRPTPPAQ